MVAKFGERKKMAKIHNYSSMRILELTRKEASDVCALLVAQLANVPGPGTMHGASPEMIIDPGGEESPYRFVIVARDSDPTTEGESRDKVVSEARKLVESGYDGPFSGDAVAPLFKAVRKIK